VCGSWFHTDHSAEADYYIYESSENDHNFDPDNNFHPGHHHHHHHHHHDYSADHHDHSADDNDH